MIDDDLLYGGAAPVDDPLSGASLLAALSRVDPDLALAFAQLDPRWAERIAGGGDEPEAESMLDSLLREWRPRLLSARYHALDVQPHPDTRRAPGLTTESLAAWSRDFAARDHKPAERSRRPRRRR